MHWPKMVLIALLANLSIAVQGADLAIKYPFIPSHSATYQTSVVKPAKTLKAVETKIVAPPRLSVRKAFATQVVAARNYANQQPLAPTISYSYTKPQVSIAPASVVIAAKNYSPKTINYTQSNIADDRVETYVVGAEQALGYSQLSKGPLQSVEFKINQNSLIGCAPLSINCSRTATDSANLDVIREPLQSEQEQQRQQVTP